LRFEQIARSLTGKRSDEGAQRLVTLRVDLVVRIRASVRSMFLPAAHADDVVVRP
jgi:hypothetical protein